MLHSFIKYARTLLACLHFRLANNAAQVEHATDGNGEPIAIRSTVRTPTSTRTTSVNAAAPIPVSIVAQFREECPTSRARSLRTCRRGISVSVPRRFTFVECVFVCALGRTELQMKNNYDEADVNEDLEPKKQTHTSWVLHCVYNVQRRCRALLR